MTERRLRALPSVERLLRARALPHAAGRARRARGDRGQARDRHRGARASRPDGGAARRARGRGARMAAAERAAEPATGDQRDRRDRAHEPRPGAAAPRRRARRSPRRRGATRTSSTTSSAGERGSRQAHVEALLRELTGAEAALAVNNCAGAVLLAAAALAARARGGRLARPAGRDRRLVPRARRGRAVGRAAGGGRHDQPHAAGRLRARDRRPDTGAILRAHPSNFRTVGFVEEVEIEELCALGVPVIDDVGSGVARRASCAELADEPPVRRSRRGRRARSSASPATSCSAARRPALMVGRARGGRAAAARIRSPARCGIDKLSLAALEATLRLYRDPERRAREVPVLAMLDRRRGGARGARAERLRDALRRRGAPRSVSRVARKVGGGALPLLELRGPAVAVDPAPLGADELARRLRAGDPPVIGARRGDGRCCSTRARCDDDEARAAVARCGRRAADERAARRSAPPATSTTARPRWSARSPATTPIACPRSASAASRSSSGTRALDAAVRAARCRVVDVPGHERFVRTMVAGATGHRPLPAGAWPPTTA